MTDRVSPIRYRPVAGAQLARRLDALRAELTRAEAALKRERTRADSYQLARLLDGDSPALRTRAAEAEARAEHLAGWVGALSAAEHALAARVESAA